MASASSIAIRRSEAQARLLAAAAEMGATLGVQVPEWPVHKNPEIARAMELETAAGVLEDVARALKKIPPAPAAVSGSTGFDTQPTKATRRK